MVLPWQDKMTEARVKMDKVTGQKLSLDGVVLKRQNIMDAAKVKASVSYIEGGGARPFAHHGRH